MTGFAFPWRIALAAAIAVSFTGSGSATIVDVAVGHWSCTVKDTSAHNLGSFAARVTIARDHKWTIAVREPAAGGAVFTLAGSWQLHGTSVSAQLTRPDKETRRISGVTKGTRAVSMFVGSTREGDFAVKWKGNGDVTFRQTASNGLPSVAGGNGDAWIAECKKVN